ncbi:SirB2 family protein [Gallibacterium trehalosifermentans]|uniref:SirB2 family protein n=1 Tax=Gallibacterium trehalosifermentans TaxID=516935 RepID=A0ABV6H272_9PAST
METLLYLHLFAAWASLLLFIIRGLLQWRGGDWRQYKVLKIFPHITDTLLLVTGLSFLVIFNFTLVNWLLIKIVALVLYIIFAAKAFKRQQPQNKFLPIALVCYLTAMCLAYFH